MLGPAVTRAFTFATALSLAIVAFVFNHLAVGQLSLKKLPLPPHRPPIMPEGITSLVLIPIVIAILLASSLQIFRKRAVQKQ